MIHDRFEDRVPPLSSHSRWRVSANSSVARAFTNDGEEGGCVAATCEIRRSRLDIRSRACSVAFPRQADY